VKKLERIYLTSMTILVALATVSCSGQDFGFLQPTPEDLCKCVPLEPDIADYRHAAKHVPIPEIVAQKLRSRSFLRGRRISSYLPTRHELGANLRFFISRTHSYKKQA
jgi:hypothetical protein